MTNITTPIQTVFELQRQSIEESQRLFERSLNLQRNATEAFLRNGLTAQRSAQEQGTELAREVTDRQLDRVESAIDENESEVRSILDEQIEQNTALTQQLLNAQFEQGAALLQDLIDAQFDALQSAFEEDGSNVRSTLDEQFEAFTNTQTDAWDEFEAEFHRAIGSLSEQQRALVAQSIEAFLDIQQDTEQQTIEGIQRANEAAQTVQQQTERVAQTAQDRAENVTAETAEAADQQMDAQTEAVGESLIALEGLGSAYADQLREQGIETVDELARSDPDELAEAADVSEEQAEEWIEAAEF